MKTCARTLLLLLIGLLLIVGGCTKNYRIIQNLDEELPYKTPLAIGAIADELPTDFEDAKKPSAEDIEKFKSYLENQISKREHIFISDKLETNPRYTIRGSIMDYRKGNGFLRFLFGAWAGGAHVTTVLEVIDNEDQHVVFSGSFKGAVGDYSETGDKMFERVAKDFAKVLEKEIKKQHETEEEG